MFESLWFAFIYKLQNFLNAPRIIAIDIDFTDVMYKTSYMLHWL